LIPVNESGTDPRFIAVLFVSALGARMVDLANDKLSVLRAEIEQQRHTIDTLRRDGHDCPDAERQLARMLAELRVKERASGPA
jgi:hypothetical protein